jgi:hypothetical protein
MSNTYIIETSKGAAGIVVRDGRGYRFFAATHDFNGLDGRLFATAKAAEDAAIDHLNAMHGRARPQAAHLAAVHATAGEEGRERPHGAGAAQVTCHRFSNNAVER